jgi:putative transcriptional regulator
MAPPARAARPASDGDGGPAPIRVRLDALLAERGMTLTELSERVGITIVNLSILKNGRARAIRFTTLAALCDALRCQPGDLLNYQPSQDGPGQDGPGRAPAGLLRREPEHPERWHGELG